MMDRYIAARLVIYGVPALIAAAHGGALDAAAAVGVVSVASLALESRLRSWFEVSVSFFAVLALTSSITLVDATGLVDHRVVTAFGVACLLFCGITAPRTPRWLGIAAAWIVALTPLAYALSVSSGRSFSVWNLLTALWGAKGLLYGAPLLWAGVAGLIGRRSECRHLSQLALAGLAPGILGLIAATDPDATAARVVPWLPFFLPGIALCFERARALAARRPERALMYAAAVMVLWNVLFMEQYRRRMLPSDDTVSFARVTSNAAALLSRSVGTPAAWPANWLFASQFQTTPDRWDAVSAADLFPDRDARAVVIEVGDDASIFAPDLALIADGFGERRTCGRGWCRDVDGEGRLLLPLPSGGRGELAIRVRVRGQGRLTISLGAAGTVVADMTDVLTEVSLPVPAGLIEPGIHVLSLRVSDRRRATVDRLTLERGL
jgi:hypothetical protein